MDVERPIDVGDAVETSAREAATSAEPKRQRRDTASSREVRAGEEEGVAANDTEARYGEDESPG